MMLEKIQTFVEDMHQHERTGHDLQHLHRVMKTAEYIAQEEACDLHIIKAISLLHEVFDKKLSFDLSEDGMRTLLEDSRATQEQIENILHSIKHLSFSRNKEQRHPLSIEGQIVQDADRLDAIGAIGIARCFYYGGSQGNVLYHDSEESNEGSCLGHFDEKLLKLKGLMNTAMGQKLAEERQVFMKQFLEQFHKEVSLDA